MAIPDYQTTMLPLLKFAGDDKEHRFRDAVASLADEFELTEKERKELLASGQQAVFNNRVGWARLYLVKANLLEATRRGYFKITEQGHKALAQKPERIDKNFLMQYPEFVKAFEASKGKKKKEKVEPIPSESTPVESLEYAFQELNETLATDLLETIKQSPPDFLERLVIDVLIGIGYGGSKKEAGEAMGRSGDGGIDGIIKDDKLGLDIIYIQAKRWENTVGRPEIQKFAGALQGKRARKGVFITTSNFSKDAHDYVKNIDSKIILIDGPELAKLMIEHNVGVSPVTKYEIKKIDIDYFAEG